MPGRSTSRTLARLAPAIGLLLAVLGCSADPQRAQDHFSAQMDRLDAKLATVGGAMVQPAAVRAKQEEFRREFAELKGKLDDETTRKVVALNRRVEEYATRTFGPENAPAAGGKLGTQAASPPLPAAVPGSVPGAKLGAAPAAPAGAFPGAGQPSGARPLLPSGATGTPPAAPMGSKLGASPASPPAGGKLMPSPTPAGGKLAPAPAQAGGKPGKWPAPSKGTSVPGGKLGAPQNGNAAGAMGGR